MSFNSYIFVLFLLPVSLLGYYCLNYRNQPKAGQIFLIVCSLFFYGYVNPAYLIVLVLSVLINYGIYHAIKNNISKKLFLVVGIALNVGALIYFKYSDFFLETLNAFLGTNFNLTKIILPLAISFFTFTQISFLVDAYNGENDCSMLDYILYVVYFPKLIQGPIVRARDIIPQFKDETRKKVNWDTFAGGLLRFSFGLGKKVLIADVFGKAANYGFSAYAELDSLNTLLVALAYMIQIYFDFSAYSDMAIGTSSMLNVELQENFNAPYLARNISDFWKRWHMSLTSFLTKYIYIPLGGNRKGIIRTLINTMIVFLISGLWHGANMTFVLWGLLNGLGMIFYRLFKKQIDSFDPILTWLVTMGFVLVCWIVFRANSISQAVSMIISMLRLQIGSIDYEFFMVFENEFLITIETLIIGHQVIGGLHYMLLYFVVAIIICLSGKTLKSIVSEYKNRPLIYVLSAIVLLMSILNFSNISVFVYEFF